MRYYFLQYYERNNSASLWDILLTIFIVLVLAALSKTIKRDLIVRSHWHHRFDTPPFTPQEFYEALATSILSKEMSKLKVTNIEYLQGGFLSPKRNYLRIRYKEFVFDVCAAPFGNGFFVSWWQAEKPLFWEYFYLNFPIFGKLATRKTKTYFELDTETMFKETVSACVRSSIEQLTQEKGMRRLSETEWQYSNSPLQPVV